MLSENQQVLFKPVKAENKENPAISKLTTGIGGAGGIRTHGRFHPSNDFEFYKVGFR